MKNIPIFQMSLNPYSSESLGLLFTSELQNIGDLYSQSLLFTIPLLKEIKNIYQLDEYFNNHVTNFQIELDNQIIFLKGKYSFPFIVFKEPNTGWEIKFEILLPEKILSWFGDIYSSQDFFQYNGNFKNKIQYNYGFIIIQPIDVLLLDELYIKYNTVFIGLTPAYDEIDEFLG